MPAHGDLLLKRFQEEEDLHVYFLLDCSRSMGFGDPSKFDLARQGDGGSGPISPSPDLDRVRRDRLIRTRSSPDFPLTRGPRTAFCRCLRFLERAAAARNGHPSRPHRQQLSSCDPQRRGLGSRLFSGPVRFPTVYAKGLDLLAPPHLRTAPDSDPRLRLRLVPQLLGRNRNWSMSKRNSIRKVTITERRACGNTAACL